MAVKISDWACRDWLVVCEKNLPELEFLLGKMAILDWEDDDPRIRDLGEGLKLVEPADRDGNTCWSGTRSNCYEDELTDILKICEQDSFIEVFLDDYCQFQRLQLAEDGSVSVEYEEMVNPFAL